MDTESGRVAQNRQDAVWSRSLKLIYPLQEAQDNINIARESLGDFKEASESLKNTLRTLIQALGGFIIICSVLGLLTLASRVRSIRICGA